jgi:hypothetical protein
MGAGADLWCRGRRRGGERPCVLLVCPGGDREPNSIPRGVAGVDAARSVERQTPIAHGRFRRMRSSVQRADVCEDAAWPTAERTGGA